MQFTFGEYEPWMKDQVVDMFCEQYGNTREQFSDYFDKFYEGFQKNKAIRLVILQEKQVAGFVSFSYWPYRVNGRTFHSYQCGNVIISKDFRGQGLYNKLLDDFNQRAARYGIDFVVGFPIKQIVKLYLRSGWKNPFNLCWHVKVVNPIGFLLPASNQKLARVFSPVKKHPDTDFQANEIILQTGEAFVQWNRAYNNQSQHFYFTYEKGGEWAEFALKLNKRKFLNELIVGEVNTNSQRTDFLSDAFRHLKKKVSLSSGISFLSICLNEQGPRASLLQALQANGFRKIEREIKFITRNFTMDAALLENPRAWTIYRRDVDTW
jgi:hypothetical protein